MDGDLGRVCGWGLEVDKILAFSAHVCIMVFSLIPRNPIVRASEETESNDSNDDD